jgi:hypothetical protein
MDFWGNSVSGDFEYKVSEYETRITNAIIDLDDAGGCGKLMKYTIQFEYLDIVFARNYLSKIYGKAIDSISYFGNKMLALKTNPPLEVIAKKYTWKTDKMSIQLLCSTHSTKFEYLDSGKSKTASPLITYELFEYKKTNDSILNYRIESQTPYDMISSKFNGTLISSYNSTSTNQRIEVTLEEFSSSDLLNRKVKCLYGSFIFNDYRDITFCEFKGKRIMYPFENLRNVVFAIDDIDVLNPVIKEKLTELSPAAAVVVAPGDTYENRNSIYGVKFTVDSVEFTNGSKIRETISQ